MKEYNSKSKCSKCGGKDVNTYYCKGSSFLYGAICHAEEKEHLHRNCQRCHYEWLEAVLKIKREKNEK